MKAHLRNHLAALCLLTPVAATFCALPATAVAQQALEVRSLDIRTDTGLQPGSRLHFRMEGTPHARAFVHIRGVRGDIPLREVERGLYVGRYVVANDDDIAPGAPVRAVLRDGNHMAAAEYSVPDTVAQAPQDLRITRFDAKPVDSADPGTVLRFTVEGAPDATMAYVDLPGIDQNVRLHEVRPGVYDGAYTLRRGDRLFPNGRVVANLRWGDRIASANLDRPLVAMADIPVEILNHPNNGTIEGDVTHVRGRTAPFARVEVHVSAVPPLLGQFTGAQQVLAETVQANDHGFFEFDFRSPFPVPGTKYDVNLVAHKADRQTVAHLVLYQRQG